MKKSGIYTRRGDKGTTSLVGGVRIMKTDPRLEAYGTVDELNAQLGLLVTYLTDVNDIQLLLAVQQKLFTVSSYLATDQAQTKLRETSKLHPEDVAILEQAIDDTDAKLPSLRAFVLPGGNRASAVCHVCRTVCRRAERRILALDKVQELDELILSFMNRLSDFLFVLARKCNVNTHTEELFWNKDCK